MPLESQYYSYSEDIQGSRSVYSLTLNNKYAELYTLAVWGRYYLTDGNEADPPLPIESDSEPDSANFHVLYSLMMLPVLGIMLNNL